MSHRRARFHCICSLYIDNKHILYRYIRLYNYLVFSRFYCGLINLSCGFEFFSQTCLYGDSILIRIILKRIYQTGVTSKFILNHPSNEYDLHRVFRKVYFLNDVYTFLASNHFTIRHFTLQTITYRAIPVRKFDIKALGNKFEILTIKQFTEILELLNLYYKHYNSLNT